MATKKPSKKTTSGDRYQEGVDRGIEAGKKIAYDEVANLISYMQAELERYKKESEYLKRSAPIMPS